MFAGQDPFSNMDSLVFKPEEQQVTPVTQLHTPVLAIPTLPLAPQFAGSQNTALDGVSETSASVSICDGAGSSHGSDVPRCGDGWYVAHRAILPGVYYGL